MPDNPSADRTALLEAILGTSIAAVCVLDPEGRITFANKSAKEIFGLNPSEVVKRTYDEPEWRSTDLDGGPWPDEEQPFRRVMRTGKPVFDVRHAIEWPNGERKMLSINGAPIKDERGEITSLVFSVYDITEQLAVERQIRESEEWLRLALDAGRMGTWSWDMGPDEFRWSGQVERIFGLRPGEFDGTYEAYLALTHPDDVEDVKATVEASLTSESGSCRIQHRLVRPDGEVRWIQSRGQVFQDPDGNPAKISGCVMDITQTKNAQLELMVSQQQLRRAQRLESVGRLAGGLAHDFNNLLTIVIGCADLVAPQLSDRPEELELISQIRDAGERGAKLTNQLLVFASDRVVKAQVLDVNGLIRSANDLLSRLIGEDVEFTTKLDPDLWMVRADPGQLEQILVNIAVNARDAMPDGGRLRIRSSNEIRKPPPSLPRAGVSPQEWVAVEFEDTGVGMDEATLERLFEPFFTTKDVGKGTGLGLAICHGIVRQAEGFIEVESGINKGTRFRIFLPRVSTREEVPERSRSSDRGHQGNETILLVEDEAMVRRVAKVALENAGYVVLEAGTAMEAVSALDQRAGGVDLLISDVVMPHANGTELARELLERLPELKVLFISGYAQQDGLSELLKEGHQFLQKPFDGRKLTSRVRDILDS